MAARATSHRGGAAPRGNGRVAEGGETSTVEGSISRIPTLLLRPSRCTRWENGGRLGDSDARAVIPRRRPTSSGSSREFSLLHPGNHLECRNFDCALRKFCEFQWSYYPEIEWKITSRMEREEIIEMCWDVWKRWIKQVDPRHLKIFRVPKVWRESSWKLPWNTRYLTMKLLCVCVGL